VPKEHNASLNIGKSGLTSFILQPKPLRAAFSWREVLETREEFVLRFGLIFIKSSCGYDTVQV